MCNLEGRLLYAVPRIRIETSDGISVKGKTERNEELIRYTEEICKALKFIGPINLQFKLDYAGKPKLVEINPRFSGGLPITAAAGINPLEILIDVINRKEIEKNRVEWKEIETSNETIRRLKE